MNIDNIDALIFDFDGVLTNNQVYVNENGVETVKCSRADGLAFDALKKLNKPTFIISSEKNLVVEARAKKLGTSVIQGVSDKTKTLHQLINKYNYDLKKILFVGNDLNDYLVMKICGYTACPADSHPKIKKISNICLNKKGGYGVARELIEDILKINLIKVLYNEEY